MKFDDRRFGVVGWFVKEDGVGVVIILGSLEFWFVMLNIDFICSLKLLCVVICFLFNSGVEVLVKFLLL